MRTCCIKCGKEIKTIYVVEEEIDMEYYCESCYKKNKKNLSLYEIKRGVNENE